MFEHFLLQLILENQEGRPTSVSDELLDLALIRPLEILQHLLVGLLARAKHAVADLIEFSVQALFID